ncbi:hypothetical protein GHO43_26725 [Pseudomonas sp. FSL R10-0071]|nr:hypothetical protein [Pseudomonas sp. FSL R10-0071]
MESLPLIAEDENEAIQLLKQRGLIPESYDPTHDILERIPTTRVAERQALRSGLDMRVKTEAAKILALRGINPGGSVLDKKHTGRQNIIILKSAIDRHVNQTVGRTSGQRHDLSKAELEIIDSAFSSILTSAVEEVFNGD